MVWVTFMVTFDGGNTFASCGVL